MLTVSSISASIKHRLHSADSSPRVKCRLLTTDFIVSCQLSSANGKQTTRGRDRGLLSYIYIFLFFLQVSFLIFFSSFFNPNSNFSRFASAVHHSYIFACIKKMKFGGAIFRFIANNPRHTFQTVKYKTCVNFISSSAPISAIEVHELVNRVILSFIYLSKCFAL